MPQNYPAFTHLLNFWKFALKYCKFSFLKPAIFVKNPLLLWVLGKFLASVVKNET